MITVVDGDVQAAIDAVLEQPGGGKIYLPAGTYSASLNIPPAVGKYLVIAGDGPATVLTNIGAVPTTTCGMVGVVFRDLSFGPGTTAGPNNAVALNAANMPIFDHVYFQNLDSAVISKDSYSVRFRECTFVTIKNYAFYSYTAAHHLVFSGCGFFNTGLNGTPTIEVAQSTMNIVLRDNDWETGSCFIQYAAGGDNLIFEGNYTEYAANSVISAPGVTRIRVIGHSAWPASQQISDTP